MPNSTSDIIRAEAKAQGFDIVRITSADGVGGEQLDAFLAEGLHGSMDWLAKRADWRADPHLMWPDAKSAIMLGTNYGPDHDPRAVLAQKTRGAMSVYALGDDYHDVVKKNLKALAGFIYQRFKAEVKVFVDTAPVMEKPLAARAGIGWAGKHTNLVSREFGSWLFLGSVFTTLDLPPDAPEPDHCGNCHACIDACPTDAFIAPYRLDARRCISYLTIEHHGPIPRDLRARMGNRIYGCDDCLAACPWNKYAKVATEQKLQAREELKAPSLAELANLDDAAFRALFRKTAIKRVGRDRFLRNVMIAIGNSGAPELIASAKKNLDDPAPVVRGAAVWALSRLLDKDAFTALARKHGPEPDAEVRAEWENPAEI
jgi:epoxyqueuosine reductase